MPRSEQPKYQDQKLQPAVNIEQFSAPLSAEEEAQWASLSYEWISADIAYKLMTDPDTLPGIQGRLLQLFTAPNYEALPFLSKDSYYNKQHANEPTETHLMREWTHLLKGDQAAYVATLLPQYLDYLSNQIQKGNRTIEGIDLTRQVDQYNEAILSMLDNLPPQQAEELFSQYRLKRPISRYAVLNANYYSPVKDLFRSKVSEDWKRKGLEKIKAVIQGQMAETPDGKLSTPALSGLLFTFHDLMTSDRQRVSNDFATEIVTYLLKIYGSTPIGHTFMFIDRVLSVLSDKPEDRLAFAYNVVFGNGDASLKVAGYDSEQAALAIRRALPDDVGLTSYLDEQLANYNDQKQIEAAKEKTINDAKRDFLNSLKKPGSAK